MCFLTLRYEQACICRLARGGVWGAGACMLVHAFPRGAGRRRSEGKVPSLGYKEQTPNEKKHVNLIVFLNFSIPKKMFFACGAILHFYTTLNAGPWPIGVSGAKGPTGCFSTVLQQPSFSTLQHAPSSTPRFSTLFQHHLFGSTPF